MAKILIHVWFPLFWFLLSGIPDYQHKVYNYNCVWINVKFTFTVFFFRIKQFSKLYHADLNKSFVLSSVPDLLRKHFNTGFHIWAIKSFNWIRSAEIILFIYFAIFLQWIVLRSSNAKKKNWCHSVFFVEWRRMKNIDLWQSGPKIIRNFFIV